MNLSFLRNLRGAHVAGELLSAYLDAQVTAEERRRVEAHLAECAACQRELASLRQTVALLRALPRVATPRAFTLAQTQVGRRRADTRPAWFGGLARGLAAVSAVALVAIAAAVLLREPAWQPTAELARVAAPAAPATAAFVAQGAATTAPAPAPKPAAVEKPVAPAAAEAVAAATRSLVAQKAEPAPVTPTAQATAAQSARVVAPQPTPQPAPEKPAAALAAAAPAAAPTAAASAAATAAPPAAAARDAAKTDLAAAAGGGAAAPAALAAKEQTDLGEPPLDVALAYAAEGSLWAFDRSGGTRRVAQAEGLTAPVISGDRAWITYRRPAGDGAEVWGVLWAGGPATLLLSERDLNKEALAGYQPRRFQDVRWLPGKRMLAVTAIAAPLTADMAPRLELWTVDVESAARRLVASSDLPLRPAAAPNGASFALFRRDSSAPGGGVLSLVGADGVSERVVLRFSLPEDQRGFDAQVGWLPDGRSLRVAVPEAQGNGLALYAVTIGGDARPVGRVEARQLFWSPDGARLAYVRPTGAASGPRELYLAMADGADGRLYAALQNGRFVAWSPDGARFLYTDNDQLFAGTPGQAALRLGAVTGEPRWLGSEHVLYAARQAASWQLVYQAVGGKAIPVQTVPADTTFDGLRP